MCIPDRDGQSVYAGGLDVGLCIRGIGERGIDLSFLRDRIGLSDVANLSLNAHASRASSLHHLTKSGHILVIGTRRVVQHDRGELGR